MPCYDSRGDSDNLDQTVGGAVVDNLRKRITQLQACLCAICSELDNRGISDEILVDAERNGIIDLREFWTKHRKSDEYRMSESLRRYSSHEIEILKRMLT